MLPAAILHVLITLRKLNLCMLKLHCSIGSTLGSFNLHKFLVEVGYQHALKRQVHIRFRSKTSPPFPSIPFGYLDSMYIWFK